MPSERRRAAALDRAHHLQLAEADVAAVGVTPRRSLASARDRLAESRRLCECDVIFEVVRTRSVQEGGYGHNRVGAAA
jgi:hypothetical protein